MLTEDERDRTRSDHNDRIEEPNVLKLQCFKDLIEASKGATTLFDHTTEKLLKASTKIRSDPPPDRQTSEQLGTKILLTEDEREQLFLREHDIDIMENDIEARKLEMQLTFTVFQAVL